MSVEKFQRLVASPGGVRFRDVSLSVAQMVALFSPPVTVVPAPRSGFINVFEGAIITKAAGTAYTIGTGGNILINYTNAAGLAVGALAMTGWADQATQQTRWIQPYRAASGVSSITPVAAAVLVINQLTANMTVGTNSTVKLRVFYRQMPNVI